jgi:hypothetical protein
MITVLNSTCVYVYSRDSSVGIALRYELDDRGSRVRFPAGAGNFSLHHRVQNGSGAHPASYPVGIGGSFRGVKRPGREADYSPPSSVEVNEWVALYFHSPNTPSWSGTLLKHRDNFTFYLYLCVCILHFCQSSYSVDKIRQYFFKVKTTIHRNWVNLTGYL